MHHPGFIMQKFVSFLSANRNRWPIGLVVILVFFVVFVLADNLRRELVELEAQEEEVGDLQQILDRGVLRASTNYNSTNYFVYRGEPMGFHLELLQLFARQLGVQLELFISNDLDEHFACLTAVEDPCDLIAQDLTVTHSRSRFLQFTVPHSQTRQVLVQRKPERWYQMHPNELESHMLRNQLDLAGQTIHVQRNSAFVPRLKSLMEEIGDTIFIMERPEDTEQLIEMVANGEISFTVSDENLARLNQHYYSMIDVRTPVSFMQNLSWAVRPGAMELLDTLNMWLSDFRRTRQYALLYNKYYHNPRSVYIAKSALHSLGGGQISVFDEYFRQYAGIVGWDWRLIASLSYQESRFDPTAVSWAGAFGIMQLMPSTAEQFSVEPDSPVPEHIRAGVNYLRWLDRTLSAHIEDDEERVKFVLASYNVGIGHVLDARRLAEKYGRDPNIWREHVDYFVRNKSKPKYYLDPVVRYGYARGQEPYNYVKEILERYGHYRNVLEG